MVHSLVPTHFASSRLITALSMSQAFLSIQKQMVRLREKLEQRKLYSGRMMTSIWPSLHTDLLHCRMVSRPATYWWDDVYAQKYQLFPMSYNSMCRVQTGREWRQKRMSTDQTSRITTTSGTEHSSYLHLSLATKSGSETKTAEAEYWGRLSIHDPTWSRLIWAQYDATGLPYSCHQWGARQSWLSHKNAPDAFQNWISRKTRYACRRKRIWNTPTITWNPRISAPPTSAVMVPKPTERVSRYGRVVKMPKRLDLELKHF